MYSLAGPWCDNHHDVVHIKMVLGPNRKMSKIGQKPGKPGPQRWKTRFFDRNSTLTPPLWRHQGSKIEKKFIIVLLVQYLPKYQIWHVLNENCIFGRVTNFFPKKILTATLWHHSGWIFGKKFLPKFSKFKNIKSHEVWKGYCKYFRSYSE